MQLRIAKTHTCNGPDERAISMPPAHHLDLGLAANWLNTAYAVDASATANCAMTK